MTSYAVQKVARDMLLILTTRCFGNARNVETSRSIKTTREAEPRGFRAYVLFRERAAKSGTRMLTIFAITCTPSSRRWPRARRRYALLDVRPVGRKPLY